MAVMLVKLEGAIAAISAYVAPASGYIEETWHDEDPATEGFVWDAYD
ncbi:MAG: hypothetical protein LBS52_10515 [Dysgonamonadaceae bacterium]|nr:hypothetical protein [Dysgonamonadaceae bacterium]